MLHRQVKRNLRFYCILQPVRWLAFCMYPLCCCLVHVFMPRSHQTFRLVLAVKLMGIMLRNRCWPTTLHTITAEDADGWC